ncbi:MAG: chemotaxis response regulator protein-glutamate methylesterase [Planctomycetes bacterium]|nr:chemotaxis response regulator protein-glutamate methylesterase [Planctomycetota bacterium]
MLRIVVVDDSALYRQLIQNVLREVPFVQVVGMARSGAEALAQVDDLAPDLLTLDVRMPEGDGIQVLQELKKRRSKTKAIMVSSLTANGAQVTMDALLEGAFDFILKPGSPDAAANRQALLAALSDKINTYRDSQIRRVAVRRSMIAPRPPGEARPAAVRKPTSGCDVVVIGTSTGGPVALREVLSHLPGELPIPVLIVQHMPPQYTHSLAQRLNENSPLEVVEACDGMTLEPGWAFLAPGGRQMKVTPRRPRSKIQITDDPPEHSVRPSVDYLFRSVAEVFGGRVLAVVMTGMGRDGTEGCRLLKAQGATVFAQHPEGCVVYGMPKAVADEDLADRILPLTELAAAITQHVVPVSSPRHDS